MKHCMYCETLMNKDAIYCPKCGKKQSMNNKINKQEQSTINAYHNYQRPVKEQFGYNVPPKKRGIIAIILGWIFIIASFVTPILGNIISLIFGIHLLKYHERKTASIALIITSAIMIALFIITGYAFGFWSAIVETY